jgi:hypothetical protein
MKQFYSYLWLRENGTPQYVGKGTGKRAFVRGSHHLRPPTDRARILIFPQDSEADAIESEKNIIALLGRKDQGTGCLRNFTDGGDGVSGLRHSDEAKRRMSVGHKGRPSWNKGVRPSEETRAIWRLQRKGQNKGVPRPQHVLDALHSPESIAKSAASRCGHITAEETKQKIGQAHLGMKATDEARRHISEGHKNQVPWNKGKTGGSWTAARRQAEEKKNGKF